ncbi:MAG: tyrosine-type recombinase/integrase [Gudongella sp.]|jgi:integrase|nr:tyrosine-type recombinase/integrase [Gudongella sp.]
MASIRKVNDTIVEITAYLGIDSAGTQIRKFKRITKPIGMSLSRWEKEAKKQADEYEKKLKQYYNVDADIPFKDFVTKWIEEYAEMNLEATTLDLYRRELDNKILPRLGGVKLGELTPMHILTFLNTQLKDGCRVDGKPGTYSDRTIKNTYVIISSILQQAVYWQLITDNPCHKIKPPKNKKSIKGYTEETIQFYDEEQTIRLLELMNQQPLKFQAAIYIALFCGLRNGEILGLTWDDIDFNNMTIRINKVRAYTEADGMITKAPKTKSSIRIISAPDTVLEILSAYKLEQEKEIQILGNLWDKNWFDTPWLFTQPEGKGMYLQTISKWFKKTVDDYNNAILADPEIKPDDKIKNILPVLSIHKLRHTSATLLISKNTDIRTVSARLGHSQTSTTMDIYVHGLKTMDRTASNALEELLIKDRNKLKRSIKAVK